MELRIVKLTDGVADAKLKIRGGGAMYWIGIGIWVLNVALTAVSYVYPVPVVPWFLLFFRRPPRCIIVGHFLSSDLDGIAIIPE
jgi:hypothetical protein